ncbi:MAG: fibronectin type III domain-containing protein [Nitrosotalea sp.]
MEGVGRFALFFVLVLMLAFPGSIILPEKQVSATPALSTPTGVTASALSSNQINVSWNPSAGAISYNISYSTSSAGPFTSVGSVSTWTLICENFLIYKICHYMPNGNPTTYPVTHLNPNTPYWFEVTAEGGGLSSSPSTPVGALTAPSSPIGVTATAQSINSVLVSWNPPASGAPGYIVYEATSSNGQFNPIIPLRNSYTTTGISYTVTNLQPGTPYWFYVTASNNCFTCAHFISEVPLGGGESAPSSTVSSTTLLAPPTGVTATALGPNQILVSWNTSTGATGYTVERSQSSSFTSSVGLGLNTTPTTHLNSQLAPNTQYWYEVYATAGLSQSAWSTPPAMATTPNGLAYAPEGVTATPEYSQSCSSCGIHIAWTSLPPETTSVQVSRSDSQSGPFTPTGCTSTQYCDDDNDGSLNPDTTYWYEVTAEGGGLSSSPSDPVSALTAPDAPTILSVTQSSSGITITWNSVDGADTYECFEEPQYPYSSGAHGFPYVHGTSCLVNVIQGYANNFYVQAANSALSWSDPSEPTTPSSINVDQQK